MTEHLITRPARADACRRCGWPVLTAISGGCPVQADIQPLAADTELAALLAGRLTYDICVSGNRVHLERRDIFRIRAGRNHPVVATHTCKREPPPMTGTAQPEIPPGNTPEKIPF